MKVHRWRTTSKRDESYEIATSVRTLWQPGGRVPLGRNAGAGGDATELALTMP